MLWLKLVYTYASCTRVRRIHMTYSEAIIKRLTELSEERKIKVNKLATLSGITQSIVEDLMKGTTKNPKLRTLHKLATGLDMTVC